MLSRVLLLSSLLLLGRAAAAAPITLVNGSFEVGPDPGSTFIDLPGGSTAITGWTVGAFHIDYNGPGTWNISDGNRNIDLDGSVPVAARNGAIAQSFATIIGQEYLVTFDLSGNPAGFPLLKRLEVSAGDSVEEFTYDIGSVVAPILPLHIDYLRKRGQRTLKYDVVTFFCVSWPNEGLQRTALTRRR